MTRLQLLALLCLAAVWGGSFPAIKAGVEPLGPFLLTFARLALAAAVMALLVAATRPAGRGLTLREALVLGTLNAAVPFVLISFGSQALPASLASVLNATTPVFGLLVGAAMVGERLTPGRLTGVVLGLTGVALCVGLSTVPINGETVVASVALLGGAASYAVAGHYVKRRLAGVSAERLSTGQLLAGSAILLPLVLLDAGSATVTATGVGAVLYLALPGTVLAYLIYFRLIAAAGATNALTVTFLVPPFGVVASALLLGEEIGFGLLVGGAVVLAGVALVTEIVGPGRRSDTARLAPVPTRA